MLNEVSLDVHSKKFPSKFQEAISSPPIAGPPLFSGYDHENINHAHHEQKRKHLPLSRSYVKITF